MKNLMLPAKIFKALACLQLYLPCCRAGLGSLDMVVSIWIQLLSSVISDWDIYHTITIMSLLQYPRHPLTASMLRRDESWSAGPCLDSLPHPVLGFHLSDIEELVLDCECAKVGFSCTSFSLCSNHLWCKQLANYQSSNIYPCCDSSGCDAALQDSKRSTLPSTHKLSCNW